MKLLPSKGLRRPRGPARRGLFRRMLRRTFRIKLAVLAVVGLLAGLAYLRLSAGPVSFGKLPERFAASLAERIGPGWGVAIRNTAFELHEGSLSVLASGLEIRNPEGVLVVRAPHALVSLDTSSLLVATVQPRAIEFRDLQLRAIVNPDGAISFAPHGEGEEGGSVPPTPAAPTKTGPTDVSPVSAAVGSLLQMLVGSSGVLGVLDEARITNARLTLVDADGRERARFRRVDGLFERTGPGGRRFEASLDGPSGVWRVGGVAEPRAGGGHTAAVTITDAPVQDLVLLSGLSAVPAQFDVKITGGADASFAPDRLEKLDLRFAAQPGVIQVADKDTSPLVVQRAEVEGSWDEARRGLRLPVLSFAGGGTDLRLAGEFVMEGAGWKLGLRGAKGVLAGALPEDAPVAIDEVDLQLSGGDGVRIERLAVRGPKVRADVTGTVGTAGDPRSLAISVTGAESDGRAVLRLWPEAVASAVRRYLVSRLRTATVSTFSLGLRLSGAELNEAVSGRPLPKEALNVQFALRDAELRYADGLPPLSGAPVTGLVTGTTVAIAVPNARVAVEGGRALQLSEGSFTLQDYATADPVAMIGLKLDGTAEAIGALLQTPLMKEIAGLDIDPAGMKGKGEFRVVLPLPLKADVSVADLPLTVTGSVSDLTVDKLFGKERLEGAALAVNYDRGNLAIKGEGKLGGSPATIDIRQARGQVGDATVQMTLDDAARNRRGLSFGPQLTGPVALKATVPLGRPKGPTRIEVDLTRAAVDQAIPGWVKPSGRPAKVSFAVAEHQGGSELRDLHVESGTVSMRGGATLGPDGQLEKADLTTFKLSPGDDMRVHVERSGNLHKVQVRGNVGDARPFTKTATAGASSAPARGPTRDAGGRDVDLDIQLNILTGHNDEAVTNASIRASIRQQNLRQLQLSGRLGRSNITGQTTTKAGTVPVIVFQADDAGSFLRFTDIYRRMEGGALHVQLVANDGPQSGRLTLRDFTLRNEPALRRIIPTQSQLVRTEDASGRMRNTLIDVNEVFFTRADVDFTRSSGRVDFKDAAIFGRQVGFTLSGFLDYARDRADISGTFVPAYGVNNVIAQVPLFGPLLSGGRHEGLFAVNFRLSGQASAPVLTVNPLSAVAPGFLRKLFGAGGGTAASEEPPLPAPDR